MRKKSLKTQFLELALETPVVSAICNKIDLPRSTYYRWRNNDQDFQELADSRLKKGVEKINDLAESQLINGVKANHFASIKMWLTNNHPKYYSKNIFINRRRKVSSS